MYNLRKFRIRRFKKEGKKKEKRRKMNKVNKNIMVLIETLLLINKNIFADLLIDNFSSIIFEEVFFNNVKSNKSFFEKKIEIIAEIKKGNKKILKKLINFNNEYVKKNYLNLSEKKYLEERGAKRHD